MVLSDALIEQRLETWPVARLASLSADGRPHLVPIVFARSRGRLWSPVDGKPKRDGELARLRHLRANPAAALLLDEYTADWTRLWWIRIDATARVIQPATADDPEVAAAIARLVSKYPQYREVPVLREPATLLAFEPDRITSWTAEA